MWVEFLDPDMGTILSGCIIAMLSPSTAAHGSGIHSLLLLMSSHSGWLPSETGYLNNHYEPNDHSLMSIVKLKGNIKISNTRCNYVDRSPPPLHLASVLQWRKRHQSLGSWMFPDSRSHISNSPKNLLTILYTNESPGCVQFIRHTGGEENVLFLFLQAPLIVPNNLVEVFFC